VETGQPETSAEFPHHMKGLCVLLMKEREGEDMCSTPML
jgi:hypothetical protein